MPEMVHFALLQKHEGPAVSNKMEFAGNGELRNVACPRWVETGLGTSHKMEHAGNGALCIAAKVRWAEMGPAGSH